MNPIDIQHYSQFYSLDKLYSRLKTFETFVNFTPQTLFEYAIKNGITDLAEYLYLFCGMEFELNELMNLSLQIQEQPIEGLEAPINSGLNITFWSQRENGIKNTIARLLNLRKYSTLRRDGKKFFYKFNPKNLDYLGFPK